MPASRLPAAAATAKTVHGDAQPALASQLQSRENAAREGGSEEKRRGPGPVCQCGARGEKLDVASADQPRP